MKRPTLYKKMKNAGYGYRKMATEINKVSDVKILYVEVYNFVHRNFNRLGKLKKKSIRNYFRSIGWLTTPKPKEKCVCAKCGRVHVKKNLFKSSTQKAERVIE